MYNVLIADDSVQLRNGLKCLIDWTKAGFRIGGEAANGREALELLSREPYHALLTDIQMPGMDGLELIRQCAESHPALELIVISGYDDFAYAKTAMRFGVVDYLLKPIVRSELLQVLDKIRAKLEAQSREQSERSLMKWKLNQNVSMLREQFMLQLVNGSVNAGVSLRDRAAQLQLDALLQAGGRVQFVSVEMRIPPGRLDGRQQRPDTMRLAFQMMCRDIAQRHEEYAMAFHDYHFVDMMHFAVRTEADDDSRIRLLARDIRDNLKHYLRIDVRLGIGRPCAPFADLKTGYVSSVFAWSQGLAEDGAAPDEGTPDAAGPQAAGPSVLELEKRLTLALEQEDEAAFADQLRAVCSAGEAEPLLEHSLLMMRVILLLNSVCRKYRGKSPQLQDDTWMCYYSLWKFEARDKVLGHILHLARRVIETIGASKRSEAPTIVDAVRDYIDNNYAFELSLSMLAEDFHINETYLSKIFKKQIGKTFSEYILEVRMAQAVKWLTQSDLKLDDIAGLIGFANASYFSHVFKRHFGCSPKAYRLQGAPSAER